MPPKSSPSPAPALPCEQCGYVNEPERVYCHNCGAKLDRSLLPQGRRENRRASRKPRKHIEKMTNPKSGVVMREIKAFFKVIFFSALLAVVLLIFQKPEDLPELEQGATAKCGW